MTPRRVGDPDQKFNIQLSRKDLSMSGGPTEDANRADESIANGVVKCVVVLLAIMLVVASLRFYIRLRLLRKAGNDDIALAATLVRNHPRSSTGYSTLGRVPILTLAFRFRSSHVTLGSSTVCEEHLCAVFFPVWQY